VLLGLDGQGESRQFASLSQWAAWQKASDDRAAESLKVSQPTKPSVAKAAPVPARKLTYNEQREWDQMESKIHAAEAAVAELEKRMNDPDLLADHRKLQEHCRTLEAQQAEVARLYDRWAALEAKQK
jgi:ATP-binding cassette subfamily F protein uup